ncbi:MAG: metallophosphoesterase family protein, partial [Vicinamibacterales bacterium]
RLLGPFLPAIMCGGHTHLQQLRRLGDGLFFNPGSVGLAWDHQQAADPPRADSWAEYSILNDDERAFAVGFRRIPYDVETFVAIIEASGIPDAAALVDRYRRR